MTFYYVLFAQTLHGTAIYAYIDPQNDPNVGIYDIHGVFGFGTILWNVHTKMSVPVRKFGPSYSIRMIMIQLGFKSTCFLAT